MDAVLKFLAWLGTKKTYIVAFLMALLALLHQLGYLDTQTYETLAGLLAGGGLATLRHAVGKVPEQSAVKTAVKTADNAEVTAEKTAQRVAEVIESNKPPV